MLALDRAQRGSVQFLTFMSQHICLATSADWNAGSLSTNTAQSVDRLSTNKADQGFKVSFQNQPFARRGQRLYHKVHLRKIVHILKRHYIV